LVPLANSSETALAQFTPQRLG